MLNGDYTDEDMIRVPYKKTGYSILCQGSQVIHHVTSVKSAKEDRMSLIISLTPANAYHPGRSNVQSFFYNYMLRQYGLQFDAKT